jgi:hypothetical protein
MISVVVVKLLFIEIDVVVCDDEFDVFDDVDVVVLFDDIDVVVLFDDIDVVVLFDEIVFDEVGVDVDSMDIVESSCDDPMTPYN